MPSDAPPGNRWFGTRRTAPLVLGHRGASADLTENTLAAFRQAVAEGADGVELDVQRCASGEVVVFHDDDLRRLAGRSERLADLPLPALREVRLLGGGEIPLLAAAIEACGPTALVNIEIKHDGLRPAGCRELVAAVADVVGRADAAGRVLVSSFSPGAVWLWRRLCPSIPCGLLFERPRPFHRPWPLRMDALLPVLGPTAVHPEAGLCTPARVARWRRRGYRVHVWTVDQPERVRALAGMGVNAVITNRPAEVLAALALTPRSGGG
jgi:glycerophosphoryl diester phosphodiesterase